MSRWSNQTAGSCDHQFFWNESTDVLRFLHVVSQQGKAASEAITFGLTWSRVSLIQSECNIL